MQVERNFKMFYNKSVRGDFMHFSVIEVDSETASFSAVDKS